MESGTISRCHHILYRGRLCTLNRPKRFPAMNETRPLVSFSDQFYYIVAHLLLSSSSDMQSVQKSVKKISFSAILHFLVPVTLWLPNYNCKKNLFGDIASGITVAVMHIPQGMAYGILASVPPQVGLYMAFFPVLSYFIFGTSRHISMGTFAVISLMITKTVQTHGVVPGEGVLMVSRVNGTDSPDDSEMQYSALQVVTAVSMMVGIYQIVMCVCRMGALSSLLSEPLVSGFTTAAAVHVLVSQIKDLLGVRIPRHKGAFKVIYVSRKLLSGDW